jgi:hypothetical protein
MCNPMKLFSKIFLTTTCLFVSVLTAHAEGACPSLRPGQRAYVDLQFKLLKDVCADGVFSYARLDQDMDTCYTRSFGGRRRDTRFVQIASTCEFQFQVRDTLNPEWRLQNRGSYSQENLPEVTGYGHNDFKY